MITQKLIYTTTSTAAALGCSVRHARRVMALVGIEPTGVELAGGGIRSIIIFGRRKFEECKRKAIELSNHRGRRKKVA